MIGLCSWAVNFTNASQFLSHRGGTGWPEVIKKGVFPFLHGEG